MKLAEWRGAQETYSFHTKWSLLKGPGTRIATRCSPQSPKEKLSYCESRKPKVWSQESTPATLHASSPLLHATTGTKRSMSVHVAVLDLSLVWLTLLESEIGRGNSISGLNNSGGKSEPTWLQMFLGQKSQNKWRPNCLVSGSQIPRSTNPTN